MSSTVLYLTLARTLAASTSENKACRICGPWVWPWRHVKAEKASERVSPSPFRTLVTLDKQVRGA